MTSAAGTGGHRQKGTPFGNLGIAPDRLRIHSYPPKPDVTQPGIDENHLEVKDNAAGEPESH
jgi:hypothetical protein